MAYGKVRSVPKPLGDLPARIYPIPTNASPTRFAILTVPFDFNAEDGVDATLAQKLCDDFTKECEDGRTYPQEEIPDFETYKSYFMAYDLVLGFFLAEEQVQKLLPDRKEIGENGVRIAASQLSSITIGSSKVRALSSSNTSSQSSPSFNLPNPSDTYAFTYYIKPNYPGRSSHLCNGGFMVPSTSRNLGMGRIAARSFLFYAPACGYRGSVFNLVYVTNEASVRLWEKLGFKNVGKIPGAGRLKVGDGEEYVDAWVVYGDFGKIGVRDEK